MRTLVSGVSTGTDKWVMQGTFVWGDISYPAVPGYQRAGIVEAVGSDVERFRPGQQVVTISGAGYDGVSSAWGTHSSRSLSEVDDVYDAEGVPAARAAFLVVAQVGYNAATRLRLDAGAHVVVVGDGVIGASAAFACRARGFDVLVAGRHHDRLAAITGVATVDTRAEDAADTVRDFAPTGVIDTVQNDAAFDLYVPALPLRTGQIVYSGHSPGGITTWADMAELQKRELTAHFVSGMTPERLDATLDLMRSGAMPSEQLAGALARGHDETTDLMTRVAHGQLGPVAAAIDWEWAA